MNMYYALSVMALERGAMIAQFDEAKLADPRMLVEIACVAAK